MTQSSEIEQLREEVRELRVLYMKLAESLIPVEEPTPEEVAAIEDESDGYYSEDEFMKLLKGGPRGSRRRSASG